MKTKRLLAYLLVAVMVLGVLPLTVAAAETGWVADCGFDEEHEHSWRCLPYTCGKNQHYVHSSSCYKDCGIEGHYSKNGKHKVGWDYRDCLECHQHDDSCYSCNKLAHKHTDECFMRDYKVTVKYVLAGTDIVVAVDESNQGTIQKNKSKTVTITPTAPENYELAYDYAPVTYTFSKRTEDFFPEITFEVNKVKYNYEIFIQYMNGSTPVGSPIEWEKGTLGVDETKTVPINPEKAPGGYALSGAVSPVNVEYRGDGKDFKIIVNVPVVPVVIPGVVTPSPAPTELPEEEIPTTEPDLEEGQEDVELEEDEEFEEEIEEDEEDITDVPQTGETGSLNVVFAMIALAGVAFVLTLKKSRSNG